MHSEYKKKSEKYKQKIMKIKESEGSIYSHLKLRNSKQKTKTINYSVESTN